MSQLLISVFAKAAHEGLQSSVTISIPGAVVSGTLISGGEYLERLSKAVETGRGNAVGSVSKSLAGAAEDLRRLSAELSDAEPQALYLAEAKLHVGLRPIEIGLWSCRVADVTGFGMGAPD
jgi:hypothetical protein